MFPSSQPGCFQRDRRKLESLPYAQPALEIKLPGKYCRVWDLLVPAFFIVAIGGLVTILVAS
jgi:hypothetical protein